MRSRHVFASSSRAAIRAWRRSPRRVPLFLESLETRVTPSVTLQNGLLSVVGDDNFLNGLNDTLAFNLTNAGGVSVTLDGQSSSFGPGLVTSIVVDPGAGTNVVTANAIPGGVPLSITCLGLDTVTLGGNQSTGTLDHVAGPVTIHGDGKTQVSLNDPFRTNTSLETYTITAGSVTRGGIGGLTYSGMARLNLVGESDSTYNVASTSSQTQYQLTSQGGAGPNTFNIGTGNLDAIQGSIFLPPETVPNSARDVIILHDEACPTNQSYTWDLGEISRGSTTLLAVQSGGAVTLNEGMGNDSFAVVEANFGTGEFPLNYPLTINGGGGQNTLEMDDTFGFIEHCQVTSSSILQNGAAPLAYSAMQNLIFDDAFGGFGEVDILSTTAGSNVSVGASIITVGNLVDGLGDIKGGLTVRAASTLTLADAPSTFQGTQYQITSDRIFRLPGLTQISYSNVANLILDDGSGSNDGVLVLDTPAAMATTINAGPGPDNVQVSGSLIGNLNSIQGPLTINGERNTTVTLFDQSNTGPETYTLTGTSTGASLTQSGGFSLTTSNLMSLALQGSSGGNQFVVAGAPGTTAVTLNGGSGTNTLKGPDATAATTTWAITGAGSGTIDTKVGFKGIKSLTGGASNDVFEFNTGGSIAGTIDGGSGINQLNYTPEVGPIIVNLQTRTVPQILGGAPGSFSNIESFVGSASTADTLIGPNADTNWVISSAGGGTAGSFFFAGFENLVGGSGVDVFQFTGVGAVKGKLDGGAAPLHEGNWLDYSGLIGSITVNLKAGSAAGVAGGIVNIQNVHGGDAGNILTGDSQGNILMGGSGSDHLTGGSGASLLIGDLGADTITGGSGGDILSGEATSFDIMTAANEQALMSILAEWQSADSYATRFTDINTGTGSGLNGTAKLNFGTTVTDDVLSDTVSAAPSAQALDWFFKGAGDVLHNVEAGEHINNNTSAAFQDRTVTSPIPEGTLATVRGTITDPDPGDSFTLVVNWGDGTPVQKYSFPPGSNGQRVHVTHRYREEGHHTIALSWTDPTGPVNHATLAVTVTEAPGDASGRRGQAETGRRTQQGGLVHRLGGRQLDGDRGLRRRQGAASVDPAGATFSASSTSAAIPARTRSSSPLRMTTPPASSSLPSQ